MDLHQRLADRQPQPQPAVLSGHRTLALLEGVEDTLQRVCLDSHAIVAHLSYRMVRVGQPATDIDAPAVRGELDGVPQQVPEHLLQTHLVGIQEVRRIRTQIHAQLQCPSINVGTASAHHAYQHLVELDPLPVQFHLAAGKAGGIEQVVNKLRFHFDIPSHQPQQVPGIDVEVRIGLQHGNAGQHGRQWRAQLMAQDRQEAILGLVRLLGRGFGLLGGQLGGGQGLLGRPAGG